MPPSEQKEDHHTGRYPDAVGITGNIGNDTGLSSEHRTLASYLKDVGYTSALIGHNWTISYYTHQEPNGKPGFFNLEADISERVNLFSQHPKVVAELRASLKFWEGRYA